LRQNPIFASCPPDSGVPYPTQPGYHELEIAFPGPLFMPQRYSVTVSAYSSWADVLHNCPHALVFDVTPAATPIYSAEPGRAGILQMSCVWKHRIVHNA